MPRFTKADMQFALNNAYERIQELELLRNRMQKTMSSQHDVIEMYKKVGHGMANTIENTARSIYATANVISALASKI